MRMHAERFDRLGLRTEADQLRADAAALSIDRLPLSPEGMIRSEEDQIKLFLEGYEAGWQRLHDAMQNVENVRAEVVRTKVRAAIEDPIGDAPSPPAPAPPPPPTPIAAIAREIETQAPAALTAEDVAAAILPADVTHANGRADGSVVS